MKTDLTKIQLKFLSKLVFVILLFTLLLANQGYSSNRPKIQTDTVYTLKDVDKGPEPEGGIEALYSKWNSLGTYPKEARRKGIEGKIIISFTVHEDGRMTDAKVEQGIGYGCDEVAVEALLKTGIKWKPAMKDNVNVKVRMVAPFVFRLK